MIIHALWNVEMGWPEDAEEFIQIRREFRLVAGMPSIVGWFLIHVIKISIVISCILYKTNRNKIPPHKCHKILYFFIQCFFYGCERGKTFKIIRFHCISQMYYLFRLYCNCKLNVFFLHGKCLYAIKSYR